MLFWDQIFFCVIFIGNELKPVTATQSSTWLDNVRNYGAANCINGNSVSDRGSDGGTALCITKSEPAPWFAIDYGTTVTVERVEIFSQGDRYAELTRNVDVRISDELPISGSRMFSGGTLLGHFAGPATSEQHITISGQNLLRKTTSEM